MSDITITALRAAAAKLAEALAKEGGGITGATNIVHEAEDLAGGHMTAAGEGIGFCGDWRDKYYGDMYGGWAWITQGAQLRLMVDALLLEQDAESTAKHYDWLSARARLGALVREWRGGLT